MAYHDDGHVASNHGGEAKQGGTRHQHTVEDKVTKPQLNASICINCVTVCLNATPSMLRDAYHLPHPQTAYGEAAVVAAEAVVVVVVAAP